MVVIITPEDINTRIDVYKRQERGDKNVESLVFVNILTDSFLDIGDIRFSFQVDLHKFTGIQRLGMKSLLAQAVSE